MRPATFPSLGNSLSFQASFRPLESKAGKKPTGSSWNDQILQLWQEVPE